MGSIRRTRLGQAAGLPPHRSPAAVLTAVLTVAVIAGLADAAAAIPKTRKKGDKAAARATANQDNPGKQDRPSKGPGWDLGKDVPRFLPDDCHVFGMVDVAAVLQTAVGHKLTADGLAGEDSQETLAFWGLELKQIQRIVFGGGPLVDGEITEYVAVLLLSRPVDTPAIDSTVANPTWTIEKVGKHTIWVKQGKEPVAFCRPNELTLVTGEPGTLRGVLRRDKPAKLPEKLERARRLLDPDCGMAASFLLPKDLSEGEALESPAIGEMLSKVDAVNLEIDCGADMAMRAAAICRDKATAQQLHGITNGLWSLVQMQSMEDQQPEIRELIGSLKVEVEGNVLAASWTVPGELVETAEKSADSASGWKVGPVSSAPALVGSTELPAPASAVCPSTGPATPAYGSTPGTTYPPYPPASTAAPPAYVAPVPYCPPAVASPSNPPAYAPSLPYTPAVPTPPPSNVSGPCRPPTWAPYAVPTLRRCQPPPTLPLADVIRLVEAGVHDNVIVRHLQQRRLESELSADDLIQLTKCGASTEVILAVQGMPVAPKPPRLSSYSSGYKPDEPNRQAEIPNAGPSGVVPYPFSGIGPRAAKASVEQPGPTDSKVQVLFSGPQGAKVRWDVTGLGRVDSEPLVCPGRHSFAAGTIHRLQFGSIEGKPPLKLGATLEIASPTPRAAQFLANNAVPVSLTDEDVDELLKGMMLSKVVYLPDPEYRELALHGVETLVSTRLEPGTDPIVEADRRGTILAILRADGKFVAPAYQRPDVPVVPAMHAEPSQGYGVPFRLSPIPPPTLPPVVPDAPAEPSATHRPAGGEKALIFTSESLREILDEWERIWLLQQPHPDGGFRTHGGLM